MDARDERGHDELSDRLNLKSRAALLRIPIKRFDFGVTNPSCLFVAVAVRIVGIEALRPALFVLVGAGEFGMRPQVISQCDVTLDVRRARLEEMKLHRAYACLIVQGAISSSRNAQLAVPAIPERLETPSQPVKLGQIAHDRHQIDDRLGSQTWNRRGADVVDSD